VTASHVDMMRHEVLQRLREHTIGRLCVLDGNFPVAFPVNYRLHRDPDGDVIVIQTAGNTTIARSAGPASLEVDEVDLDTGEVWSVIVRGHLRRVPRGQGLPETEPLIATGRDQWLTLDVTSSSGRTFHLDGGRHFTG
jgi:nitroimidazol reductase NimA-like FMN-containing flavoprotein (pyridoxamine 5'-phosphate oxidase superfamily)